MRIKLIQWNISYNCKIDKIIEYLKSHIKDKTIICLQEVLVSFKEELIEGLQPDNYSYSLDYRKPGLHDGKKIGHALKELEKEWVQNDFNLSSKEIDSILNKIKKLNILNT